MCPWLYVEYWFGLVFLQLFHMYGSCPVSPEIISVWINTGHGRGRGRGHGHGHGHGHGRGWTGDRETHS